jgi:hypothetical protein
LGNSCSRVNDKDIDKDKDMVKDKDNRFLNLYFILNTWYNFRGRPEIGRQRLKEKG